MCETVSTYDELKFQLLQVVKTVICTKRYTYYRFVNSTGTVCVV